MKEAGNKGKWKYIIVIHERAYLEGLNSKIFNFEKRDLLGALKSVFDSLFVSRVGKAIKVASSEHVLKEISLYE